MKRIALVAVLALVGVALFTPWLFGQARGTQTASRLEAPYPLTFPDNFAWGVAVAAQHVEHQQPSDWTAFERHVIREGKTGTGDLPGRPSRDTFAISTNTLRKSGKRRWTSTVAMPATFRRWLNWD